MGQRGVGVAADELDEQDEDDDEPFGRRHTSDGQLRSAMLDDGQPWLTWWLLIPGIALAVVWAGYHGAAAPEPGLAPFLETLRWPGVPIFLVTTITTYFGWRLDLD